VVGRGVARQLFYLAAVRVDGVQPRDEVDVPPFVAEGREDEALPIRGPARPAVFVHVDDEEMRAPVGRPADAVELVEEARQPAWRALAIVLLVIRIVAHA